MKMAVLASCTLLGLFGMSAFAKGYKAPIYHPPPCEGAECPGDDQRSGLPCQGLLCSVSSAKAMQPPVTASEAAEAQSRAAAATATGPPTTALPKNAPPSANASPAPGRKKQKAARSSTMAKEPAEVESSR